MASTGAIPRTKKFTFPGSANFLPPDTQILVGHEASEPLEGKMLTVSSNGVQTKIPALHKSWCCPRQLIHFSLPPSEGLELQGALDAWLEQMDFFRQDLEWMLALPHHRFWSEVVHCRKVHACLESYLTQAPRWYDDAHHDVLARAALQHGDVLKPVLADVHRLVLLVHVRMTTYKESKSCHITPTAFGSLLYDNYVLDVCQLLDLCTLYFPDNAPLLSKMITNVFEQQPSYSDDLRQVITSIQTALDNVEQRLGVSDSGTAVSLRCAPHVPDLDDLRAIVYYLLDTCCTLHAALQVYPPAAATMHEMELHIRLCVCYERCVPCLSTSLARHRLLSRSSSPASDSETADNGGGEDAELMMRRLQQLRAAALAVFREVVDVVCLSPLREDSVSGHNVSKCLESYLHIVSSCLAEKTFIADYHTTYSFTTDIDLFKKRSIDATSLQFIAEAVHAVLEEMGVKEQMERRAALCNGESVGAADAEDHSGMSQYALHGSSEVDALQLTQLVSSVQDLMPGLGAGFITRCLRHYHYSAESVINALLEDSLPPSLTNLDRSEAAADVPPDIVIPAQEDVTSGSKVERNGVKETAVGEYCDSYEQNLNSAKLSVLDRANVYNDDEFDVFSARPVVDRTRVHRGKRKNKDAEAVPDDAVKQRVRDLGQQYEQRAGRSIYEDEEAAGRVSDGEQDEAWVPTADYNDEYDDTYDDNEAGNLDATTEIMMPARRGRAHPAIFGKGALNAPLINGCDTEEEEEGEAPGISLGVGGRPLPTEENEEEFGRRRGLRKGLGGVDFMLELRESGGSDPASRARPALERNLPPSHDSQRKRQSQKRNLPPIYHRDHHRPPRLAQQDNGEEQETDESEEAAGDGHRLSFTPFCEDPAVARQRLAERYASKDAARNRGGNRGRRQPGPMPPPQPLPGDARDIRDNDVPAGEVEGALGGSSGRGGARPKTHHNAKSGKAWRHGTDEEARGSRGGKYKEDTNHGSAQDSNYRRKMEHKNKARKQAAQNKFNKNN